MNKKENSEKIVLTMMSVTSIVLIAKVLGFIKQVVTANAFGATLNTDIITIAEGMVINLDFLLVQTLTTAFVPVYIQTKEVGEERARRFVSNVIIFTFIITLVLASTIAVGSPVLARILAPTYGADISKRLSHYLRLFAPVIIVIAQMAVFNALLKANKRFVPGELISVNQSLILIVLILFLGSRMGADILVVGFYVYAFFNLIFLMIWSRKYWHFRAQEPFKDENVRKMLTLMGPLIIGYAMVFINQQVDKVIVSGMGEGIVTSMNYAAVLSNFVGSFIASISAILFTYVTQNIVKGKEKDAAAITIDSVVQMVTLFLPVSTLTVMNSNDIVSLVFGRGHFNSYAVNCCALALLGYGFSFVPLVLREICSRFQYGYGDSKTPMLNSTVSIIINIVLSIVLGKKLGVVGVTSATSISVLCCAILNARSSVKKNEYLDFRGIVKYLPRWILGVLICIAATIIGSRLFWGLQTAIRFLCIASTAMLGYYTMNYKVIMAMALELKKSKSNVGV